MDQQKRGQQSHGAQQDRSPTGKNDEQMHGEQSHQNREPAEGSRENVNTGSDADHDRSPGRRDRDGRTGGKSERGTGSSGERNSGGISNRGMDPSIEQRDLPARGSTRESER